MKKIAIIGGGAAGLMAAIAAARLDAQVTIYERCDRAAKKILATGNGRCNMTNINAGVSYYHGNNPEFICDAINNFWISETLDFFSELGILSKIEKDGKVYPYSLQASAVSEVLRSEAERLGVETLCGFEVSDIEKKGDEFILTSYSGEREFAQRVILATGGKASPDLGSNGSGYPLAQKFGHKLTKLYPALCQIKTNSSYEKALQGIKINAKATFVLNSEVLKEASGEVLFTDYGLSGPPVFELSRLASVQGAGRILLDLMPEYSEGELFGMIFKRRNMGKSLEGFMTGILPKKLGQILMKSSGIAPLSRQCSSLTKPEISALVKNIKKWNFPVVGTKSWNNAQVTAGGIETEDVDPVTMQSKLSEGLYFAGEILDIDGDCGGYNLQWAWSSGYIAGTNAAVM